MNIIRKQPFTIVTKIRDLKTPVWIYFASIIAGILALLIIAYILYKVRQSKCHNFMSTIQLYFSFFRWDFSSAENMKNWLNWKDRQILQILISIIEEILNWFLYNKQVHIAESIVLLSKNLRRKREQKFASNFIKYWNPYVDTSAKQKKIYNLSLHVFYIKLFSVWMLFL